MSSKDIYAFEVEMVLNGQLADVPGPVHTNLFFLDTLPNVSRSDATTYLGEYVVSNCDSTVVSIDRDAEPNKITLIDESTPPAEKTLKMFYENPLQYELHRKLINYQNLFQMPDTSKQP